MQKADHTDRIDLEVFVVVDNLVVVGSVDKASVGQEPLERLVVYFGMVAVQMEEVG